jgi:hypothetical protein
MTMVCGIDLHRQQVTFDAVTVESGEVKRPGFGDCSGYWVTASAAGLV